MERDVLADYFVKEIIPYYAAAKVSRGQSSPAEGPADSNTATPVSESGLLRQCQEPVIFVLHRQFNIQNTRTTKKSTYAKPRSSEN